MGQNNIRYFKSQIIRLVIILIMGLFLSSCITDEELLVAPQNTPSPSDLIEGELPKSTPEEQGMDRELLEMMMLEMNTSGLKHHSLIIVRNGTIIMEEYFENEDFGAEEPHPICSGTKSIVSILIGIAINEGYINNVEQPIIDFFPGREFKYLTSDKKSITLKNLLSMSSGLRCRDSYVFDYQDLDDFSNSFDRIQFVLDLPMESEPGKVMNYCNGVSHLLSAIITNTTGMSTSVYAYEKLFKPLGIENITWGIDSRGINLGYTDLYMKPRDMAKIGELYLNKGFWGDKQIVSPDWVIESTMIQSYFDHENRSYGYQWWVEEELYYFASGAGGQFIFVIPEKMLVVVFTNELYGDDFWFPERLLNKYIIPAVN